MCLLIVNNRTKGFAFYSSSVWWIIVIIWMNNLAWIHRVWSKQNLTQFEEPLWCFGIILVLFFCPLNVICKVLWTLFHYGNIIIDDAIHIQRRPLLVRNEGDFSLTRILQILFQDKQASYISLHISLIKKCQRTCFQANYKVTNKSFEA